NLVSADVVLLLISVDFLHSDYAYGPELRQALEQHQANRTRVVPVILRYCDWNFEGSMLANLQALPTDAVPIEGHPRGEDFAFTEVGRGLRQLAKALRESRPATKVRSGGNLIAAFKIGSESEADTYLRDLLAKTEYRSMTEVERRAKELIHSQD